MTLFLTYGAADRDRALELVTGLRSAGHTVLTDHRLAGDADWWSGILTAIQETDLLLYAASTGPPPSPAAVCEREYASALGMPVLEIRLPPATALRAAKTGTPGSRDGPAERPIPGHGSGAQAGAWGSGRKPSGEAAAWVGGGGSGDQAAVRGSGRGSGDQAAEYGGWPVVDFVEADAAAAFRLIGAVTGRPARSPVAAGVALPESPFAPLSELAQDVQAVAIDQLGLVERLREAAANEPAATAVKELAAIVRNRLDLDAEAARRLEAAFPRASIPSTSIPSTSIPSTSIPSASIPSASIPSASIPSAGTSGIGTSGMDISSAGESRAGESGMGGSGTGGSGTGGVGGSPWARPATGPGGGDGPAGAGSRGGDGPAGVGSGGQSGQDGPGGTAAVGAGGRRGSAWARPAVDALTEDAVRGVAFGKATVGRRGYDERGVDEFLDLVEEDLRARREACAAPEPPVGPVRVSLTPADVRAVRFDRPPFGRRGYDEEQVDSFLDQVERAFTALDAELGCRGTVTGKG